MSTGTYSLVKVVVTGDVITAAERNAEHQNHINNSEPDGIGCHSDSATEMRQTTDPYPGAAASLATDLTGEIERLRYVLAQITGETYWYIDPDTTLAALAVAVIPAGTKAWFYQDAAPTGWTIDSTPADALLAVKGGSQAFNAAGGTQQGTWTQPNHLHSTGDFTLTENEMPAHTHSLSVTGNTASNTATYITHANTANNTLSATTGSAGTGAAHNHGNTGNSATANTWRPLSQLGIIATKN